MLSSKILLHFTATKANKHFPGTPEKLTIKNERRNCANGRKDESKRLLTKRMIITTNKSDN
jgi:hypothetical protein